MNMSTINWPALRAALYSVAGGVVACLGAFGFIAPDKVDGITQAVTAVIGAAAMILAAANVGKKEQAADTTTVVVEPPAIPPRGDTVRDILAAEADRWLGQLPTGSLGGRHRLEE